MRKLLTILLVCISSNLFATNYYFSATGSDGNAGTSTGAPWQTLSKFNGTVFAAGDHIYFNRGDVFFGGITFNFQSGSAGNPIIIDSYGSGANPIITGLTNVTSWTNLGSNIWESTSAVSTLSTLNMVVINGVNTPMGRWPNSTYAPFQTYTGDSSLTSSSLNAGTTNWTGAEAVVRTSQFTWERSTITSASSGTIKFGHLHYPMTNNFKFFIEDDARTLDSQNEWYYDPSTKKIRVYSTSSPTGVQVATVADLVDMNGGYLTIKNIDFTGANNYGVLDSDTNPYDSIYNCNFNFSGINGIQLLNHHNLYIANCTVNHSQVNGLSLDANDDHVQILGNTVSNSGMLEGMGLRNITYNNESLTGILTDNLGATVKYNNVTNSGYAGISFNNDSVLIQYNRVDSSLYKTQDGGGIYTFTDVGTTNYYRRVLDNIVSNSYGESTGTDSFQSVSTYHAPILLGYRIGEGIYLDDSTANVEVGRNTVFGCHGDGILVHMAINCNVHDNNVYNNTIQFSQRGYQRWSKVVHNQFVSKASNQLCMYQEISLAGMITLDSNYYARPVQDDSTIKFSQDATNTLNTFILSGWQSYSSADAHSNKSPKTITDTSDLRFDYNATGSSVNVNTTYAQKGIDGSNYNNGIIPVAAWSSIISIKNGAIVGGSGNRIKVYGNRKVK